MYTGDPNLCLISKLHYFTSRNYFLLFGVLVLIVPAAQACNPDGVEVG